MVKEEGKQVERRRQTRSAFARSPRLCSKHQSGTCKLEAKKQAALVIECAMQIKFQTVSVCEQKERERESEQE